MGKVRRGKELRKASLRPNPVGIPSVRSIALAEAEGVCLDGELAGTATEHGEVESILQQLRGLTTVERERGLNALAVAAENPPLLQELISSGVFPIAATLLLDHNHILRQSAAGALRNASEMGPAVCGAMVVQGVLKNLVSLLHGTYGLTWRPRLSKVPKEKGGGVPVLREDASYEAYVQALHLLWNLCESSEDAVKVFNREKLFPSVFRTLDAKVYGIRLAVAGAHCLQSLTEENAEAYSMESDFRTLVVDILSQSMVASGEQSDWMLWRILVVGIFVNMGGCQSEEGLHLVMARLREMLEVEVMMEVKAFSSEVPLPESGMDHDGNRGRVALDLTPADKETLEKKAQNIETLLEAQTHALEILSNLLFLEGDEDNWEEESDEECMTHDAQGDGDISMETSTMGFTDAVKEVCECVVRDCMVEKVLGKCVSLPVNVYSILVESLFGCHVAKRTQTLRLTAFLCLQNLIQALDVPSLGGGERLRELYAFLNKSLSNLPSGEDFLEAVTAAIRASLQKATEGNVEDFLKGFSPNDLDVFMELYSQGGGDWKVGTNVVRMVGGIGMLVASGETPSVKGRLIVSRVGDFLLSVLSSHSQIMGPGELVRIAEALDTIFDVFAKDDYNDVLMSLGILQKLRVLEPQFRKHVRSGRELLGESRVIAETARMNLSRFLAYKKKQGC